ncbi:SLOG family protein [Nocardia puris]|uniref:Uncharacterized protein DUF2493 n=1 Tax=Nocardia puris TaxID=208602 RepID=A0A366DMS3_9NOCA|nr:SLOG family protein [Nocardia puris]RBO91371.1 uncharacterized protein DUF2493 [Nocardia puris]
MSQRILVTGSRNWDDVATIHRVLGTWWQDAGRPQGVELVHGACPYGGADLIAARFWLESERPVRAVPMHRRACDSACRHSPRRGGCPRAGPDRNQRMVDLGHLHAFAFPLPGSRGTRDCIARIVAAGIPLTITESAA